MFSEAIETILRDYCTGAVIRDIEKGDSRAAADSLWQAIAQAGFLELLAPESAGGAALSLRELFPVITQFGRYALPVPAAQSIAARALLLPHGATVPAGRITLAASCRVNADGAVDCPLTPFGMVADTVLANDRGTLLVLSCNDAERAATGVRGNLTAGLRWRPSAQIVRLPGAGAAVPLFGAALHAAMLAGAMNRVFEMTLQYGNDRVQFGRSIGKFQAIQHQLSVMAEHVAAAMIAAELAFATDEKSPQRVPTAIAKARTSEAVSTVASIAHAVHGAIGITEEFDLQLYTRRLHEWRIAHGAEAVWNDVVGEAVLRGAEASISDFVRTI